MTTRQVPVAAPAPAAVGTRSKSTVSGIQRHSTLSANTPRALHTTASIEARLPYSVDERQRPAGMERNRAEHGYPQPLELEANLFGGVARCCCFTAPSLGEPVVLSRARWPLPPSTHVQRSPAPLLRSPACSSPRPRSASIASRAQSDRASAEAATIACRRHCDTYRCRRGTDDQDHQPPASRAAR
jgi:hypothetical protein